MGTRNKIPATCKYIGCSYKLKNVNTLGGTKRKTEKKKETGLELQEDRGRQGERLSAIQSNPEREAGGKRDLSANRVGENPSPDSSLDRYRNVSHHKQQRERPRQTPRSRCTREERARGPGAARMHFAVDRARHAQQTC